jgi:S1-C subfamily serine protease
VITAIDGQELRKFEDLISYLARATVGSESKAGYIRDGKTMQVEATLEARPSTEKRLRLMMNPSKATRGWVLHHRK